MPVDPVGTVMVMGTDADGTALSTADAVAVSLVAADDDVASVIFTAGVFTSVSGADNGIGFTGDVDAGDTLDLSTVEGAVTITGDVAGTLTLATTGLTNVTVTGDVWRSYSRYQTFL